MINYHYLELAGKVSLLIEKTQHIDPKSFPNRTVILKDLVPYTAYNITVRERTLSNMWGQTREVTTWTFEGGNEY